MKTPRVLGPIKAASLACKLMWSRTAVDPWGGSRPRCGLLAPHSTERFERHE
jgi:hypothetical protein